jgi:uroporphyrinogen-III decarboxylase
LYSIKEVNDFTSWSKAKLFKTKDDYKKILFMLENTVVFEVNNAIKKAARMLGDDVVLRGDFGYEPLQEFISGDFFSTEQFCIEWMDNRDEILKLYNANVEIKRKAYKIAAESPIDIIIYGGNVTPAIISPKNFEEYYLPHYEEACEVLKPKGKIVGCHFDADLSSLKDLIAKTSLDIIEAFTPYPDTDMTMAEAKKSWPDKVLWINFPSSVHLESIEKIKSVTKNIIESVNGGKLIIGITEDVPENRWQGNYEAIMEAIDEYYSI